MKISELNDEQRDVVVEAALEGLNEYVVPCLADRFGVSLDTDAWDFVGYLREKVKEEVYTALESWDD